MPQRGQPTTTVSSSTSYSVTSSSNTASSCNWPSIAPSNLIYDPSKASGIWWVYRSMFSPEAEAVGMRLFWHILGPAPLPMTNFTGDFVWCELVQYNSINDTQCNHGSWTGYLATTGQNVGFRFLTVDNGDGNSPAVPARSLTLYQDDNYQFYYVCLIINPFTGNCDSPFATISGRSNPTSWTQAEKDHVDNDIILPLIKQWGCTAKDIPFMQHPSSKPVCDFSGSTTCLNQFSTGYSELIKAAQCIKNLECTHIITGI
ncbi:uncharacterized protein LOC129590007 isoform X1 [Paramacrobiotus metropolitanus]|uniref:uncharacterized protein LOC129590007 isoform X1 n=1 Tax=Paramacrobiotus metropolitanus TaxID=2943436 RepID=UPI002445D6C7|nr:uncharacterized protein LOC129590007 isoform X1 [Paramacrobiotus metropolitanus]